MFLLISHDISLHPDTDPEEFERFVRDVDYPTCPAFRSLLAFTVVRDPKGPGLYRELIFTTGSDAFAKDMESKEFRDLEKRFSALATVTSETVEEVVGEGYGVPLGVERKEA